MFFCFVFYFPGSSWNWEGYHEFDPKITETGPSQPPTQKEKLKIKYGSFPAKTHKFGEYPGSRNAGTRPVSHPRIRSVRYRCESLGFGTRQGAELRVRGIPWEPPRAFFFGIGKDPGLATERCEAGQRLVPGRWQPAGGAHAQTKPGRKASWID